MTNHKGGQLTETMLELIPTRQPSLVLNRRALPVADLANLFTSASASTVWEHATLPGGLPITLAGIPVTESDLLPDTVKDAYGHDVELLGVFTEADGRVTLLVGHRVAPVPPTPSPWPT